ncbi:DUF6286 domain-containing Asp23/Gls24 family envelope stress response protein [Streptomyces sp. NPDC086766]|uniref:DUF6286 domain-containing Asp23/Gls24 family envelope stress response protein n=1 Tax=Streptomyces sp. NPDC086766 TaxID=3365754 RepID=UPI0037F68DD8
MTVSERDTTTVAERGTTTVSDRAVRKIAAAAVREALPGRVAGATGSSATVRGRRAEVALEVTLPYPAPLAEGVRTVQRHIAARTRLLTGLDVAEPAVNVTALADSSAAPQPPTAAPSAAGPADAAARPGPRRRTPRRWWSRRRLPTALLTLAAALACGALAFDLILVRTGHRPPAAWRTGAADWLAHHGPGDPPVVLAGAVAAALGLWLLVLAATPGRRGVLTVTSPAPGTDVAVDRSAVAALVRDAVAGADGVGPVTVRVRRRRATVRAALAFGEVATARDHVTEAARHALADCGLRRTPRLRVVVTPDPVWTPPTPAEPAPATPPLPPPAPATAPPAEADTGDVAETGNEAGTKAEADAGAVAETGKESGTRAEARPAAVAETEAGTKAEADTGATTGTEAVPSPPTVPPPPAAPSPPGRTAATPSGPASSEWTR